MSIKRIRRSGITVSSSPKGSKSLSDASGLPGPPLSFTGSPTGLESVSLSWSEPFIVGDSPITSYTVTGSGSITVTDTTATVTGLAANTSYTFTIRAQNALGLGISSTSSSVTTFGYNSATGGTETTVSNYNGTGQTWKVHTFRSAGTLTVTSSTTPFSVLLVGNGGGGGGPNGGGGGGGGGGAGGVYTNASMTLSNESYGVTLSPATFNGQSAQNGARGQGEGNGQSGGASGAPTSFSGGTGFIWDGGGGGGSAGAGFNADGNGPRPGGPGLSRNITGTASTYGVGGTSGGAWGTGQVGTGFPSDQTGGVIVSYRIS